MFVMRCAALERPSLRRAGPCESVLHAVYAAWLSCSCCYSCDDQHELVGKPSVVHRVLFERRESERLQSLSVSKQHRDTEHCTAVVPECPELTSLDSLAGEQCDGASVGMY